MDESRDRTEPVRERGVVEPPPSRRPVPPAEPPETAREPVPGIRHEPEPDAGNIMPAEDEPGTL